MEHSLRISFNDQLLHPLCHKVTWYVANVSIIFDAPCLFYTNYLMFYLCFGVLFIHFLELTYWQDATVRVPFFCCFWFQKSYIENILRIGRDKNQRSYINRAKTEDREGVEEGQQGGHTHPRRSLGLASVWAWCGPPGCLPASPLRLFILRHGKTLSTRAQFHEKFRRRCHRQP